MLTINPSCETKPFPENRHEEATTALGGRPATEIAAEIPPVDEKKPEQFPFRAGF
jgi:hypothetical protein